LRRRGTHPDRLHGSSGAARPAAGLGRWEAERDHTFTLPLSEADTSRLLASLLERPLLPSETQQELFAGMGHLPNEAYTRLRAAERLVAEGRRSDGDEQLRKSLAFFRSVGATHFVREGEALLAAAG
jgi:hypothetical protein